MGPCGSRLFSPALRERSLEFCVFTGCDAGIVKPAADLDLSAHPSRSTKRNPHRKFVGTPRAREPTSRCQSCLVRLCRRVCCAIQCRRMGYGYKKSIGQRTLISIEMALSMLKKDLRARAIRTSDILRQAGGDTGKPLPPETYKKSTTPPGTTLRKHEMLLV